MNELINIQNDNGVLTVSSREIAEHFEKRHCDVLEAIEAITTENSVLIGTFFIPTTYKAGTGKNYKEYLLTRDGFSLLVMGFTGTRALDWKLKYIAAFNQMEQAIKQQLTPMSPLELLETQVQAMKELRSQQEQQSKAIAATNSRIDEIRDVVAINPQSWREECRRMIVKIAQAMGGNEYIKDVQAEIFRLVDVRGGVSLSVRLTNKRRRMADEGVCKSKRDKLTKVDVIADDKKLIEIYVAIVKEMSVKHGIAAA